MKIKRFACAFLAAMLCLVSVPAMAKNVTAVGMGVTESEAESDALRNAVEHALGVLVDAQTLVKNYMVIHDQVYTQSRGFITNYTVRNRQQSMGGWEVTIDADVDDTPNSRLMTELTRLGIIDHLLRNPRIAVYIPEQHLQYRVPDPAGETAVVKSLVDAGFTNVIEGSSAVQAGGAGGSWSSKPYAQMGAEDLRGASRFFAADILVVGEAFSEGIGDVAQFLPGRQRSGMHSCRARVEAKMYIAQTGQVIAADGTYGSGLDISQAVASKKALAAAGQQMGEYLVGQLLSTGPNRQGMEVVVIGADFAKINQVQSALSQVHGASNVQLSRYESGKGVFSMHYGGAPQALFREIQAGTDADLVLQSMAYNTLTIQVR